jgi:hypothetical protein
MTQIFPQVEYRYFLTDLLSNQIISEVPFRGVSYARVNRRAGSFSGTIPFIEATKGLDLYEATMPGRTGLYIMRNNVCVWGGIIWGREYEAQSRELGISASEFMSYYYHRTIWQTIQYGTEFVGIFSYQVSNGTALVTTETPHGFRVGQRIAITFTSPLVDGNHIITAVTAADQFEFETTNPDGIGTSTTGACRGLVDSWDVARDLIFRANTDLAGINFANEAIKPSKEFEFSITSKERSGNTVTLRGPSEHNMIVGQEIEVVEVGSGFDGIHIISEIVDNNSVRFNQIGSDVPPTSLPGIRELNVVTKELFDGVATITVDKPHNASIGQTVFLNGVDAFFTGRLDSTFNGRFTITNVPTPTSFSYISGGLLNSGPSPVAGGIATFGAKIVYADYGSYVANSDIGVEFENFDKSGFYQATRVIRGFEQRMVGEILEEYSNTVDGGFEYRIDCDYDFDTAQFTRTFRIIPVYLDELPPSNEYYEPSDFGADRLVFEYPGNMMSFSVEESAEYAATRFWVVGNIEDLADSASQPYGGTADRSLLDNPNGKSWPLLDQVETLDNVEDEETIFNYSKDYLFEAKPPMGVYDITVNGSLDPQVGTYFPGDWCSLIIDDEFVRSRLASDEEPREDVLVRKIDSYEVSVPDNPVFPEEVKLTLISDWKVDQRGN